MLSPSGILLFDLPDDPNDIDESFDDTVDTSDKLASSCSKDIAIQVEVEDSLGELENADEAGELTGQNFDKKIIINGLEMSKARALSKYGKTRKFVSSTDRLK